MPKCVARCDLRRDARTAVSLLLAPACAKVCGEMRSPKRCATCFHEESPRRGRQIIAVGGASAGGASETHGKRARPPVPGEGRDHRRRRRSERRRRERSHGADGIDPATGWLSAWMASIPPQSELREMARPSSAADLQPRQGCHCRHRRLRSGFRPPLRLRRRLRHPSLGAGKRGVLPWVPFAAARLTPPTAIVRRPLRGLSY